MGTRPGIELIFVPCVTSTSPLSADDWRRRAKDLATNSTGLRDRVEMLLTLPFLAFPLHADLVVSDPHVPHVKVAISPPIVREPYLRPVRDGDPVVGGPPVHDCDALGTTWVGLNQEVRVPLGVLVAAVGSRHRLACTSAAEALVVCRLRAPLPDCFPTTASEPIEGTTVDSSPVDHRTLKSDPVTPVTTPSRGASPTFLEEICTRSPTTAMYRMVPRRGVSGRRFSTPFACSGAQTGGRGNGTATPDDDTGRSNDDFQW